MQAIERNEEVRTVERSQDSEILDVRGNVQGTHRWKVKDEPTTIIQPCNLCGKRLSHGLVFGGGSVFFSRFSQCETMDGAVPNRVYATNISWCLENSKKREAKHLLDAGPKKRRKKQYRNRTFKDNHPMHLNEIDNHKKNSFSWGRMNRAKEFNKVDRVCRVLLVTTERLMPLRMVTSVDHFKQAMRDLVLARHLVFTSKARNFYRDLNIDSLMVRYHDDGSICGVLVDLDLAEVHRDATEGFTGTRTGTRPFMAWELLEPNPPRIRLERYDWESFFYVISWIGCRFSDGKEVNSSALVHWSIPDNELLLSVKISCLCFLQLDGQFTPFCESMASDWAFHIRLMFREGIFARNDFEFRKATAKPGDPILDEEFDEATLGGCVTWERFWGILRK